MTTINFCSKKIFIRKIVIKETEDFYIFEGEYNISRSKSYIIIKKLKFNKDNYKELYSQKLEDILIFSEKLNKDELFSSTKKSELKESEKIVPINDKSIEEINSIFGFIKFNMGYYVILACNSDIVGKIGRNIIYRVDKLKYFPLFEIEEDFQNGLESLQEKKYFNLVQSFSYDKQLYFSYSYNLTNTLQRNFVECFKKETDINFSNVAYKDEKGKISLEKSTNYFFCWNYFHIEEFFDLIIEKNKNKEWINYFIYGYFGQNFCNIRGFWLQISVIGRRNRHFAGTRYLKRGITSDGNVANDVETEQILEEVSGWIGRPKISSFIQIRGSIPVYWFQTQNSFYHKPEIKVNLSDIRYEATKRHFASLIERYGVPCIVCNLTKKIEEGKKQETLLNELYFNGISYINDSIKDFEKIIYYHYDLKSERMKKDFYKQFYEISCPLISKTNLFSFIPDLRNKYSLSLQNGVIRTNCIDCLDRTNVFQQILGIAVLIIQLRLIGINESFPENENESIYGLLTEMYRKMGHELSNQYTGTFALKQSITDNRNILDKVIDIGYEIIIACKRSMINYFNDQTKQNSMNLFLGKYKINSGEPLIWEMPSDDALHKRRDLPKLPRNWYEINYKKYCEFNLFKDLETKKLENDIYIQNNFDEKSLNKNNHKSNYKMSKTTKLICKSLYKDQTMPKINNSNYSNSNINEYTIDYSEYILNRKIKNEEKQFNEDSLYRFITGKKCLENFSYFLNENKNNNENDKIIEEQKQKNFLFSNMKKSVPINFNNLKHQKTNSPGKSNDNYCCTSPNYSTISNIFYNSNSKKDIEKLNLTNFQMNEKDLNSIAKYIEPLSKDVDAENLYKIDTFDINEDDMNEILNENKNINFEEFYNYEEEKKKEEEIATEINDTIYYDPINNVLSRYSNKNKNNDEIEKNIKKYEEDNKIIQENEENNVNKNKDKDEENEKNSINLDNDDKENNMKISIRRVKFDILKIEEDYFTEKEKQN